MPLIKRTSKIKLPSGRFHNHTQVKIYLEYEVYYALLAKLDTLAIHPEQFFQKAAQDFVDGQVSDIPDQRDYEYWLNLNRKEVDRIVQGASDLINQTVHNQKAEKYARIIRQFQLEIKAQQRRSKEKARLAKRESLSRELKREPKKASQKHLRELFDVHAYT